MGFIRQKTLYDCSAVEELMEKYFDNGGWVYELEEGCLGYGIMVMGGDGLKTTIVKEVPLNEWSSAHTIRMYNKMPKKYAELIEKKEKENELTEYEQWTVHTKKRV